MNSLFITANVISDALQPLIDFFGEVLVVIHSVIGSWGWSIILMTFLIRAVLVPLTIKQIRSMQRMQLFQPEIKAIQTKYKGKPGDSAAVKTEKRAKLNEELMGFYRENQINPLASCLPLLAQMPVFISLFYLLQQQLKTDICPTITWQDKVPGYVQWWNGLAANAHHKITVATTGCGDITAFPGHPVPPTGQQFLFIPDLTSKASGAVLVTLIVLYVGSQLGSSLMMTTTMDKTQRNIMLAMPLVFVFFILSFPAGLILYWITTNTWTVGQQYVVKRFSAGGAHAQAKALADSGGGTVTPEPEEKETKGFMAKVKEAGAASKAEAEPEVKKPKGKGGPPPARNNKKRTGRRR